MRRVALAALCALGACRRAEAPVPPPPAPVAAADLPPVRVQEHEPNDFQRPQQLVSLRTVVAGAIDSSRDEDWYRLSPGPGVTVALHLELAPAVSELSFEVLDRDRNRVLRGRASPAEPGFVTAVACTEACFIKLSGAVGAYELTVLGGPPSASAELEPNDRAVDATVLSAGKPMSGTYGSSEDEDWYRLAVPVAVPGQFLRVEVSGVDGVRPELEVRALSDGALLATFRAAAAGDGIFVRDLSLQLGVPEARDAKALPALQATVLSPDAGRAAARESVDAGPSEVTTGGAGADPGISNPAADGGSSLGATPATPPATPPPAPPSAPPAPPAVPIAAPPSAPPEPPAVPIAAPPVSPASPTGSESPPDAGSGSAAVPPPASSGGFYFVLKSSWPGKKRPANPRVPYTLTANLEIGPKDLELEPNDDPAHASPLDGTASGWLAPSGDTDWYRLRAAQPMILHVEVSPLERADVELSVWAPASAKPGDKPRLLARANEGGVREGEVLPAVGVPAGDSFIKIESATRDSGGKRVRDGEDRDTLYHLTATLSPDDGSIEREPNNDVASAQPIALPATLKGYVWPRRDVDLFRFHVEAGRAPVSVRLSAVRGVDLMLRLLELKGAAAETIGSANAIKGEGEEQILSVPLKEGDYAVEVSSPANKDASATQPYTLVVE